MTPNDQMVLDMMSDLSDDDNWAAAYTVTKIPLVESRSRLVADPVGKNEQLRRPVSSMSPPILVGHPTRPPPKAPHPTSFNQSSRSNRSRRRKGPDDHLSWNSGEVAERYRVHLDLAALPKARSTELGRIESDVLKLFVVSHLEPKFPKSNGLG